MIETYKLLTGKYDIAEPNLSIATTVITNDLRLQNKKLR